MKAQKIVCTARSLLRYVIVPLFLLSVVTATMAEAQADPPPPGVLVETIAPKAITETDSFPGRVVASSKVDIIPQVSGIVTSIQFKEGWPVVKGDVLYTIDPAEYEAAVASAKAAILAADAAADLMRIEWDRKKQLFDKGTTTESELQLATARLAQTEAQVDSAKVALDLAQIQLDRTTIYAPADGRMGLGKVSIGALVGPLSGSLVTVVSSDPIKVEFLVPLGLYTEYLLGGRNLSDVKVSLILPDGSTYGETADIDFASPIAESTTNSVILRGVVANPDYLLIDQQSVEVIVSERDPGNRLTVPKSAFLLDQIGTYVLVVGADNIVAVARPDLGREFGQRMEVLGSLEEGAKVIVAGHAKARVGQPVTPTEKQ